MKVCLVRHAAPVPSASQDPAEWPLSAVGIDAAQRLVHSMPLGATWVASTEAKAVATLAHACPEAGVPIHTDQQLCEVHRPGEPFNAAVMERRGAWVEGRLDERHAGWERPADVGQRMAGAIASHAEATDILVVGSHGMAITALMVHLGNIPPGAEAGAFWRSLEMPAVLRLDL